MSAIFCQDDEQRSRAFASVQSAEHRLGRAVTTEILDGMPFYLAEDYHQKYRLRRHGELTTHLLEAYPALIDFVNSTAATRLNAYVAGYGRQDDFERELPLLGLSERAQHVLSKKIRPSFAR